MKRWYSFLDDLCTRVFEAFLYLLDGEVNHAEGLRLSMNSSKPSQPSHISEGDSAPNESHADKDGYMTRPKT